MTTIGDAIGVHPSPSYSSLSGFFNDNRQIFAFMANHLNSPFANYLLRELSKQYPDWNTAYHHAVCATQDALKFVGRYDLARKLSKHTIGLVTFEGFELLKQGVAEFELNMDRLPRRLR